MAHCVSAITTILLELTERSESDCIVITKIFFDFITQPFSLYGRWINIIPGIFSSIAPAKKCPQNSQIMPGIIFAHLATIDLLKDLRGKCYLSPSQTVGDKQLPPPVSFHYLEALQSFLAPYSISICM